MSAQQEVAEADVSAVANALESPGDNLFRLDRVVDVHIEMAREEWLKLQPPKDAKLDGWSVMQALGAVGEDIGAGKPFHHPDAPRPGLAGYLGVAHQYGQADVTIDGERCEGVGVRYKGNGTFLEGIAQGRISYKIDFNEFDEDGEFRGLTKINLHSNVTDQSMLREAMSYALFREAGVACPRIGLAHVQLTVGGEQRKSLGLYTLVEQVDRRFLKSRFGTKQGLLLKPSSGGAFRYQGDTWEDHVPHLIPKTEATPEQQQHVMDFARLLTEGDDAAFAAQVEQYLDVDEFLRFLAVNVLLSNLDSFLGNSQNYYVHLHPDTMQMQLLPWDLDHSYGGFPLLGTPETRMQLSIHSPGGKNHRLINRVLAVEAYRDRYDGYLEEFQGSIFAKAKMRKQLTEAAETVADYLREFPGYHRADRVIGEAQRMAHFVDSRHVSLTKQLSGESAGVVLAFGEGGEFPFRLLYGMIVLFFVIVGCNLIGWILGVVAGFRTGVAWGIGSMCLYPLAPMIHGGVKRPRGVVAAIWALLSTLALVIWFVCMGQMFPQ